MPEGSRLTTEQAYIDWVPFVRHASAAGGYDVRTVQALLGHADVSTTMVYTHVLNKGSRGILSPLDAL